MESDIQHNIFIISAAMIATIASIVFPQWFAHLLVKTISNFAAVPDTVDDGDYPISLKRSDADWVLNVYFPRLDPLMENITVSLIDKIKVLGHIIALVMRVFYSFIWQEQNPITKYLYGYY